MMHKKTITLVFTFLLLTVNSTHGAQSSKFSAHNNSENPILKGIDISHYQGDFVRRLSGEKVIDFVICKATQGLTYVDDRFEQNWVMLKQEGYVRGAYHFFDAAEDGQQQALHFMKTVSGITDADIAPVVDIEGASLQALSENTVEQNTALIKKGLFQFLAILEKHYGRKPIVYTNYTFAQKYLSNKKFADYPLWLAEYSSETQPNIPTAWQARGFKIWQKSESYKLDSTELDYDVFYGTLGQLLQ